MGIKGCHLVIFLLASIAFAQRSNKANTMPLVAVDSVKAYQDPNKPARAAFYSAVLPGLGQAYNGSAWKIPIVYGAIGGGIFVYLNNDRQYDRLRDAFRIRLAGGTNDEFSNPDGTPIISTLGLERAQQVAQRNKELSLLITAALYMLQVIEANVQAHLSDFNVDRNLSVNPFIDYNQFGNGFASGLVFSYTF